ALRMMQDSNKVRMKTYGDFIIGLPAEKKETIELTLDFAKELDVETIQVSIAHAYPGTELYQQLAVGDSMATEALADSGGHQLPHIEYPGLPREEMMAAVNRFYDAYYFRPRVVWRIVREALWDAAERQRLYTEAVEYLRVRSERRKYARKRLPSA